MCALDAELAEVGGLLESQEGLLSGLKQEAAAAAAAHRSSLAVSQRKVALLEAMVATLLQRLEGQGGSREDEGAGLAGGCVGSWWCQVWLGLAALQCSAQPYVVVCKGACRQQAQQGCHRAQASCKLLHCPRGFGCQPCLNGTVP